MNKLGEFTHIKTGDVYIKNFTATNTSKAHDGQKMVSYRNQEGQELVMDEAQFLQEFKPKASTCCVCGTTDGLRSDGRYGYRCGRVNCMVF